MLTTFLGLLAALTVTVNGQDKKPDFSGLWVMVSPEAGNQVLIKQDATTFSYGPPATGQQGSGSVVKLDGSETRRTINTDDGAAIVLSKASWNGNQLVVTNAITGPQGQKLDQVLRWSFDEQGQLVMEVQNNGQDPLKMIYKKSPAA